MSRHLRAFTALAILAIVSIALLAACDGGDGSNTDPTDGTPQPPATPTPPTFPDIPFEGTRDKIEEFPLSTGSVAPTLMSVNTFDGGPFDRMEFFFDVAVPRYSIEYVDGPITACGSGLPVEVAGTRFLQIRMQGTAAHNDAGEATITNTDLLRDYPTILQLTLTCDFEGEVVWIAGLSEEVNFKTLFITTPFAKHFIVIDVNHPGRD